MYRCSLCKKEENDENSLVLCSYCCKCDHFACKGVYGRAVDILRNKTYFCSAECSEIHHRSAATPGMETTLREEIRGVLLEVQNVHRTVNVLQQFNSNMETNFLTLLNEFKSLKAGHDSLKDDVVELQQEHESMNETVSGLQLELDRINRAALSKHAVIMGVPAAEGENIKQLVVKIASAVKYQLPESAIMETKRIALKDSVGKTAPIKVVFANERYKEELFQKKKDHGLLLSSALDSSITGSGGSRIILRDELTSFGMKLLKEARVVQEKSNVKFVWPGRNGVILAKTHEGAKIETIRSMQDVINLQRSMNKRQLNDSILNSTGIEEPDDKRQKA